MELYKRRILILVKDEKDFFDYCNIILDQNKHYEGGIWNNCDFVSYDWLKTCELKDKWITEYLCYGQWWLKHPDHYFISDCLERGGYEKFEW